MAGKYQVHLYDVNTTTLMLGHSDVLAYGRCKDVNWSQTTDSETELDSLSVIYFKNLGGLGIFCAVVKMPLGVPVSHIGVHGSSPGPDSSASDPAFCQGTPWESTDDGSGTEFLAPDFGLVQPWLLGAFKN